MHTLQPPHQVAGCAGEGQPPGKVLTIADQDAAAHGVRFSGQAGDAAVACAEAARLFSAGRSTIPVQATYPLERASEAQARSAAGHARGRLVLTVP